MYLLSALPISPYLLALGFPSFLSLLLLLSCTPQTYLRPVSLLGFLPYISLPFCSRSSFVTFSHTALSTMYGWQPRFWHVPCFILPNQHHVSAVIVLSGYIPISALKYCIARRTWASYYSFSCCHQSALFPAVLRTSRSLPILFAAYSSFGIVHSQSIRMRIPGTRYVFILFRSINSVKARVC